MSATSGAAAPGAAAAGRGRGRTRDAGESNRHGHGACHGLASSRRRRLRHRRQLGLAARHQLLGQRPVARTVDVEAFVAFGQERHRGPRRRSCRLSSDDARPRDLEARVLHVDRRQRLVLAAVPGLLGRRRAAAAACIRLPAHHPHLARMLRGTSRRRAASRRRPSARNACQARRIVSACRNGLVGRRMLKQSYRRPSARSASSACSTHSMSGERSPAISAGRRNGTSAP